MFTPKLFYPWRKTPQYPLNTGLGEVKSQAVFSSEEEKFLPEIEPWTLSLYFSHYTEWATRAPNRLKLYTDVNFAPTNKSILKYI